ncbi:hypothetical protein ACTQ49_10085 [Luteococcus sp. Sow4_B9]|uniref:hypothetical protein n=1 Tax=Luteococcus sp. Sow4_B9 TaxID=3438792 RepID=UPI003F953B7A
MVAFASGTVAVAAIESGATWAVLLVLPLAVMLGLELSARRPSGMHIDEASAPVIEQPAAATVTASPVVSLADYRAMRPQTDAIVAREDAAAQEGEAEVVQLDFRRSAHALRAIV